MTEIQQNPNKGIMEQVGSLFLKVMSILQEKSLFFDDFIKRVVVEYLNILDLDQFLLF